MPPNETTTFSLLQSRSRANITSNLYSERDRVATFRDWSNPALSADELAANGFYYTGRDDIVRCAFCGIEVKNC